MRQNATNPCTLKPKDIYIFGPDGSGKSTIANMLMKYYCSNDIPTKKSWMRGRHSIAYFLAKFFEKLGYTRIEESPNGLVKTPTFDPSLLHDMQKLWQFIEFTSILPIILVRVNIVKLFGYQIVAERCVVDTVVYLAYWLGDQSLNSFLSRVLLSFLPRNAIIIHMTADIDTLILRHPFDAVSKNYLAFQQRVYKQFARKLATLELNSTLSNAQENFNIIKDLINKEPQQRDNYDALSF